MWPGRLWRVHCVWTVVLAFQVGAGPVIAEEVRRPDDELLRRLQTADELVLSSQLRKSAACPASGQSISSSKTVLGEAWAEPPSLCVVCKQLQLDQCRYDVSECASLSQGSSCRIRCRQPYVGASSEAICPSSGIDSDGQLQFTLPECVAFLSDQLSCDNQLEIPKGYMQLASSGEWVCSPGYAGQAIRRCNMLPSSASSTAADCEIKAEFLGCEVHRPCTTPEPWLPLPFAAAAAARPRCAFDVQGCDAVFQGANCNISCRAPFVGPAMTASCPAHNTDPLAPLQYADTGCQLSCPDPLWPPTGYLWLGSNRWACDEGYAGVPTKTCNTTSSCELQVVLDGCKKKVPCAEPPLDRCTYDWSTCGDRLPGQVCDVKCQTGFTGFWNTATCSEENTDPEGQLKFIQPFCIKDCKDPIPLQAGYRRADIGPGYFCAEGFTGRAIRDCNMRAEDCAQIVSFSGCSQVRDCKALPPPVPWPGKGNVCELNNTMCSDSPVRAGESCAVTCRAPYIGQTVYGSCQSRNTDPFRELTFERPPSCMVPECPDFIPVGYMKTSEGWSCATGFGGNVLTSCTPCGNLVLRGCFTALPCVTLEVSDNCLLNVSSCETVAAGKSCEVECGDIYRGRSTSATCPLGNIDPLRQLEWAAPLCELNCPDPSPLPAGYSFTYFGGARIFSCAVGYTGEAIASCRKEGASCTTFFELSGCFELLPCLPFPGDPRRFEAAACMGLRPGLACELSCQPPFEGNVVVARCPAGNTDPLQALVYLAPPSCRLSCDTVPVGYEKGLGGGYHSWKCAEGFVGNVSRSCRPGLRCPDGLALSGCKELVPCGIPDLDDCRLDVADCSFQRGTSCEVRCRDPWEGTPAVVHCPINNTVVGGGLLGLLPNCKVPACPEPAAVPRGYLQTASGWECGVGFVGQAVMLCSTEKVAEGPLGSSGAAGVECVSRGLLMGCSKLTPCAPLLVDACQFSAESCNSLAPGSSCEVLCKEPYRATVSGVASSTATCPEGNIDPQRPPLWTPPDCTLECARNATKDPEGYSFSGGAWSCAANFTGAAAAICALLPGECRTNLTLENCSRLEPCVLDSLAQLGCGWDAHDCPSAGNSNSNSNSNSNNNHNHSNNSSSPTMAPGQSCHASCTQGYSGGPFTVGCPVNNTVAGRPLQFSLASSGAGLGNSVPPQCARSFPSQGCFSPEPLPKGYLQKSSGDWTCLEGFLGDATAACEASACGLELELAGCSELLPCKAPAIDVCWFDGQQCSALMPGTACQISCASGTSGSAPTTATCPANNTEPSRELEYVLPNCTLLSCPAPAPVPAGYELDAGSGNWRCAGLYEGVAISSCAYTAPPACQAIMVLSGCKPLASCQGPAYLDACKFAVNFCKAGPISGLPGGSDNYQTVQPGGSCEVGCNGKLSGSPTTGSCPLNNTDPWQQLIYDPPLQCECPEPEPEDWPLGYNQSEADGGWICEEGYAGVVKTRCTMLAAGCVPNLILSGCAPIVPCEPLNLSLSCEFEVVSVSDNVLSLAAGGSLEVRCRAPAVGDAMNLTCPTDNTQPGQLLVSNTTGVPLQLPQCGLPSSCPDPPALPEGFSLSNGIYSCAQGFAGNLRRTCRMTNASFGAPCALVAELTGCKPLANCSAVDHRIFDTCMFNTSACPQTMLPGQSCQVGCRSPFYLPKTTAATCPTGNTNPLGLIEIPASFKCQQDCPEPEPVPAGYGKEGLQWLCAPGYTGTAAASCEVTSFYNSSSKLSICSVVVQLSGCTKMVPCQPLNVLNPCIWNLTGCQQVPAGGSCSISCRDPPYVGGKSTATCEANNTNPIRALDFDAPPVCVLQCPVPDPMPEGYNLTDEGTYECMEGYLGTALAQCLTSDADCSYGVLLTGCGVTSPCLAVDQGSAGFGSDARCGLDLTPATCGSEQALLNFQVPFGSGRGPAGSCQVACREPCRSWSSTLIPHQINASSTNVRGESLVTCPAENTDSELPMQGALPSCMFDCDPLPEVGGYFKAADGRWSCAEGFAGEAYESCAAGLICDWQLHLTGCSPIVPCSGAGIDLTIACTYDDSLCRGTAANASCEVQCRAPYFLGGRRPALCAHNNTDPDGKAVIPELPDCAWSTSQTCPNAKRAPTGYVFNSATGESDCVPGYAGKAVRSCGLKRGEKGICTPEAILTGCAKLTNCIEPQIPFPYDCRYNTSACESLEPGSSCEIGCLEPYFGSPTIAMCPWTNNAKGQEPQYVLPACLRSCPPSPDQPLPAGYVWREATRDWTCDEGYTGEPTVNCTTSDFCEWMLAFEGCTFMHGCLELKLNLTSCEYDVDNCTAVGQGEGCEVRCREPYFGTAAIASCPAGNTNPEEPLLFDFPQCSLTCPEPAPVPGHVKNSAGVWQCGPGYVGEVGLTCTAAGDDCVVVTTMVGCLKLVNCTDADPRTLKPCIYDVTNCTNIAPGKNCSLSCQFPFSGGIGHGKCPVNNTNPKQPLLYTWPDPSCALNPCPDPLGVVPEGYERNSSVANGSGSSSWQCRSDHVGKPLLHCEELPAVGALGSYDCSSSEASSLSGCLGKVPCPALPLDTCILDTSNCSSEGIASNSTCTLRCKAPYVGTAGSASCPSDNTDPWRIAVLQPPVCSLNCSSLSGSLPLGYRRDSAGGFECETGYAGHTAASCYFDYAAGGCGEPRFRVSGCFPLSHCLAPVVDLCMYDVSDCAVVNRSSSCGIRCIAPYSGSSTTAGCPPNNTDALEGLERNLPACSFADCPDPETLPLGYTSGSGGSGYQCANGYVGSVARICGTVAVVSKTDGSRTCLPEAKFSGCQLAAPPVPCQAPIVDQCLYDASQCAGSNLAPGASCDLACKQPYYGPATRSSCPPDNLNTSGGLLWSLPTCRLICQDPTREEAPAYLREGGSWRCAEGYVGLPETECVVLAPEPGEACGRAKLLMTGCVRTERCVALPPRDVPLLLELPAPFPLHGQWLQDVAGEGFEVDVSRCASLGPGESCLMSCRPPFVGASAAAHCPLGNTDPFQKPLIDAKSVRCRLECPLRVPAEDIPDGYELSADRASLSVDQGTTNNNINKNLSWKCAEGFVGDALKHCNASKICNASDTSSECAPAVDLQFEFVGCKPVQPCAMAVLDPCKHNQAVGCPGGVGGLLGPGQSCEVMCRPPFTGPSSVARCPANNTLLFGGGLQFQLPGCEVEQCHDPVPPGYMRTFDGWECAEGWIGRAVRGCATDANCEPEVALSGCAQLLPCKVPASADKCRWNFTACAEARNGATCEIHCQSPFYRPDSLLGGRSSTGSARCAAGNADPNRELEVLFPPQCTAACEEPPAGPPLGFVTEGTAQKLPTNNNNSSSTGYRCAESFAGEARAECVVAPDPASLATSGAFFCRATLNFSGCSPRTACAALPLLPAGSNNNSSSSKCKFDAFSCGILQAGTQCPVPCKAPYSGSPGYALCHLNNTDSTAPPLLREPTCSLPALCEDPVPLPAGYVLPSAGGIACAKGYAGRAQRSCLVHEETGCQLTAVFSGCLKLSPCLLPAIPASDCELDASACDAGGRLEPGASCEVTCRTPLQGTPATVRCPASNTDERFAATWTAPICGCPDPKSVPLGYIKAADLWTCAGGFVGRAVKNCLCGAAAPMLSGCTPPVSCGAAGFVDDDARQGYVSGVLHFGPASLGEVMDEFGVSYYEVFLADDCGVPVSSKPLAEVLPRTVGGTYHGLWPISCCKGDVYAVSLASMALPSNAAKFLIVARTASGPTPDGLLVPLEDFNYESSGRSGNKTIVGNAAAPRSQNWRLLFATAAAAASWQVVSTTTETPVFG